MESANALLEKLRSGEVKDGDTKRSIYHSRHWTHLQNAKQVGKAISILQDLKFIKVVKEKTTGRPTIRIFLDILPRTLVISDGPTSISDKDTQQA